MVGIAVGVAIAVSAGTQRIRVASVSAPVQAREIERLGYFEGTGREGVQTVRSSHCREEKTAGFGGGSSDAAAVGVGGVGVAAAAGRCRRRQETAHIRSLAYSSG